MARDFETDYDERIKKQVITGIVLAVLGIIVLIILFGSWYTVGAGQRAVILKFGKPIETPFGPGFHFKIPIYQSVVKMNVQTQKYEAVKATAASQDLQTVTTDVTVNYHILPANTVLIYTNIGENYQDVIIQPAVQEVVKAITAKYTAEQLITQRTAVKDDIDTMLNERLLKSNIIVDAISITNFDFSPQFNAAIEGKVTAEQNALAAKNKLAQVEFEAQQRVAQAQGEAQAIQTQVSAINAQGGASYVQLQAIHQWDGKLPIIMSGNSMPFIDLRSIGASGSSSGNVTFSVNATQ